MPANANTLEATARYHDRLLVRARNVARATEMASRLLRSDDLRAGFRVLLPLAAQTIRVGQQQVQVDVARYYTRLISLEAGETFRSPVDREIAGTTFDGRSLETALSAVPGRMFAGLKQGWSVPKALDFVRFALVRTAMTEVLDGADRERAHQDAEAGDLIDGWFWRSRGTCGACLSLDNSSRLPAGTPLQRHPYCICTAEPSVKVPNATAHARADGRERFASMSPAQQNETLGEAKAEALRTGHIGWEDLVAEQNHPQWRPNVVEASLGEAEASAAR